MTAREFRQVAAGLTGQYWLSTCVLSGSVCLPGSHWDWRRESRPAVRPRANHAGRGGWCGFTPRLTALGLYQRPRKAHEEPVSQVPPAPSMLPAGCGSKTTRAVSVSRRRRDDVRADQPARASTAFAAISSIFALGSTVQADPDSMNTVVCGPVTRCRKNQHRERCRSSLAAEITTRSKTPR